MRSSQWSSEDQQLHPYLLFHVDRTAFLCFLPHGSSLLSNDQYFIRELTPENALFFQEISSIRMQTILLVFSESHILYLSSYISKWAQLNELNPLFNNLGRILKVKQRILSRKFLLTSVVNEIFSYFLIETFLFHILSLALLFILKQFLRMASDQGSFFLSFFFLAVAAAKSLQSCQTLCDPIDGSPPGSPVPGILKARTLEWVAISFSNAWKWKVKVKALSRVQLFATPWIAAYQAPP